MYTVANLKNSVSGILTGINLNNVTNLNGAIQRAARTLVQKAKVLEASSRQAFTLYDHVYDYAAPTNIFGSVVYDFRPQGAVRNTEDYVYKYPLQRFDRNKRVVLNGVQLALEFTNGTPILRVVSARTTARSVLDTMDVTTGWVAAGTAGSLAQDQTIYYENPDSLRFTLIGSGTGTLTKTISTQDLSSYKNVGVAFLALYIPTASNLTSVTFKIGSDASNYTSVSATQGFLAAWTNNNWLLVSLDLSTGTNTGTPDYTKINYIQLSFAHSGTITNMRGGSLWLSLPSPYEMISATAAIFMALGATPSTSITTDADSIILNDAAYTLMEWESSREVALQQGGRVAASLLGSIEHQLDQVLYPLYRADNPTEQIETLGNYYYD